MFWIVSVCLFVVLDKYPMNHWTNFNETQKKQSMGGHIFYVVIGEHHPQLIL